MKSVHLQLWKQIYKYNRRSKTRWERKIRQSIENKAHVISSKGFNEWKNKYGGKLIRKTLVCSIKWMILFTLIIRRRRRNCMKSTWTLYYSLMLRQLISAYKKVKFKRFKYWVSKSIMLQCYKLWPNNLKHYEPTSRYTYILTYT